ncbi:hypothetical protein [Paenarthrobacter sp. C1]|uniref:hypothetical protein n=1 Tax=Paenarthrobacter sp. C1 TaxID=3400220 RepID=UPI0010D736E7|nr:hypothetical protein DFO47_102182 [Arthrobacter sp. AG258]
MDFPTEPHTHVYAVPANGDPVVRILCEILYGSSVGRSCRHHHEIVDGQYFDLPIDLGEIDLPVVIQERDILGVVKYPLLQNIIRPTKLVDPLQLPELGESVPALTALPGELREIT